MAYRRGETGQVARALLILDALRGFRRGRPISELASVVGVSTRTVRRDLEELRTTGFEIEALLIDGKAAARLVERSHSHIAITRRERYTLLAIASFFDALRGTPLWEDVASLQKKLEQRMSPDERAEHATFGDRFAYVPDGGTKAYQGKEDVLDGLLTGVLSRRVVRFGYRDARGRPQRGLLAPFTMLLYKHGLYVVGCRLNSVEEGRAIEAGTPLVVYAAERFSEVEAVRGSSFTPPADFRLQQVLHGAFGVHVAGNAPTDRVLGGQGSLPARTAMASDAADRGTGGWSAAFVADQQCPRAVGILGAGVGAACPRAGAAGAGESGQVRAAGGAGRVRRRQFERAPVNRSQELQDRALHPGASRAQSGRLPSSPACSGPSR
jgi:hypothetical protein